jgi:hypothetical protein
MTPYKYSVDDAVFHVFAAAPKRHRQELLRIFDFLAKEPFTEGPLPSRFSIRTETRFTPLSRSISFPEPERTALSVRFFAPR